VGRRRLHVRQHYRPRARLIGAKGHDVCATRRCTPRIAEGRDGQWPGCRRRIPDLDPPPALRAQMGLARGMCLAATEKANVAGDNLREERHFDSRWRPNSQTAWRVVRFRPILLKDSLPNRVSFSAKRACDVKPPCDSVHDEPTAAHRGVLVNAQSLVSRSRGRL
jgi:hypothetical protein